VVLGLGVLVVLVGVSAWSIEDSYGSGLNFTIEQGPGDLVSVYEEHEDAGPPRGFEGTLGRRSVFEGTPAEARDYTERRRAAGKNFVLPGAIMAVGLTLIILSFVRRRTSVSRGLEAAHRW
jgi:hypothetical protein